MNGNSWTPYSIAGDDQYNLPEGGSVDVGNHTVTNVDYREGSLLLTAVPTGFNIGDKFVIKAGGLYKHKIVGRADKTLGSALLGDFTATIVAASGSTLKFYPKFIANDRGTVLERAYSNVDNHVGAASTISRLEDGGKKSNLFWDKSAIEILVGTVPSGKFKEFAGLKTMSHTMKNGVDMFMVYDGNIEDMTFRFRLFTWYGITVCKPQNCGVALRT
jgi:hypothetical protein